MTRTVPTVAMAAVAAAGASLLLLTEPAPAQNMNMNGNDTMPPILIAFGQMYGVDGPFVGDTNPIRGVIGDELPWQVASARGRLDTTGHLRIRVRGLVFTHDPEVPPNLQGTNDEQDFRALVSCLSEDETGSAVTTENVTTEGFPATPSGDSDIDAMVALPSPCVAPIVFVLSGSEDKWFAVIGFESSTSGTHHPSHPTTTMQNNQSNTNNPFTMNTPSGMPTDPFDMLNDPFGTPNNFDMPNDPFVNSATMPLR